MWVPVVKDIEKVIKQTHKLLTVKEDATIAEAAKKMSDNQVGCLVVFNMRGKFVGMLTERDMLAKVLATSLSPDSVLVKDIMTAKAISCSMETPIGKAERLMAEHKIRHIPILENGVPVGMISSRDVIAYRLHSNKAMKAAAEQLALLSTGLKSLDFDDVIALAINEVPKSFEAEWAILYFAQKNSSAPIIHTKGCPLSKKNLLVPKEMKELSENRQVTCGKTCDECEKLGGQAPRLVIPLSIQLQCEEMSDNNVSRQGFLCMCRFDPLSLGSEELQFYKASLLQEVLSVNLTNAKLYQNYQKARRDSETDPLTGVGTRRVLEQILRAECTRALRYNHCFSAAIVDLDNFKQINDKGGHAAGDRALQKLAEIIRHSVRTTDLIARYGGDEFVLLMPETKLNEATVLLERLRRQVKDVSTPEVQSITISCGVVEWDGSADTAENILRRADAALYEAKHKGRNCVIAGGPTANTI
jgi:diguanylate cyclase (GGDEF)-like protein